MIITKQIKVRLEEGRIRILEILDDLDYEISLFQIRADLLLENEDYLESKEGQKVVKMYEKLGKIRGIIESKN